MKILVLGPKGVGKTTFINKMLSEVNQYVIEVDTIDELSNENVIQSYLILPGDEIMRERCSSLNIQEEINKWTKFYNENHENYTMTWVTDF